MYKTHTLTQTANVIEPKRNAVSDEIMARNVRLAKYEREIAAREPGRKLTNEERYCIKYGITEEERLKKEREFYESDLWKDIQTYLDKTFAEG
jgi:hypothetical protein